MSFCVINQGSEFLCDWPGQWVSVWLTRAISFCVVDQGNEFPCDWPEQWVSMWLTRATTFCVIDQGNEFPCDWPGQGNVVLKGCKKAPVQYFDIFLFHVFSSDWHHFKPYVATPSSMERAKRQFLGCKYRKLSHLMRLWYFSSSVNSFFKCTCAAIQ